MNAKSENIKIKMFALVRDQHGKPVIDDLNNIPIEISHALTEEDRIYIEEMKNGNNSPSNH